MFLLASLGKTNQRVSLAFLLAAAAAVPARAAEDPSGRFFATFSGRWTCDGTPWAFDRVADASSWTRVTYAAGRGGGTAVVGYVAGLRAFVYRDFHNDGSYADLHARVPDDGTWVWSGPYYPGGAAEPLQGEIRWIVIGPRAFRRTFASLRDGKLTPMGGDTCTRVP